jgi:transcriptional regulator with XRE-family HTH domain
MKDEFIYDLEEKFKSMRAIRQRAGWTQEQIANVLGVDRTAIIKWEKGNQYPRFNILVQLVRLLDNLQLQEKPSKEKAVDEEEPV